MNDFYEEIKKQGKQSLKGCFPFFLPHGILCYLAIVDKFSV